MPNKRAEDRSTITVALDNDDVAALKEEARRRDMTVSELVEEMTRKIKHESEEQQHQQSFWGGQNKGTHARE